MVTVQAVHALELALAGFAELRTPGQITRALRADGLTALENALQRLSPTARSEVEMKADQMDRDGIGAVIFRGDGFPGILVKDDRPVAPILFYQGKKDLLYADGVGMCGSRHVSAKGLEAAGRCGELVTHKGMSVVSGYAAGVDTATHLAALRNGGSTVVVLAEGFNHFRVKKNFADDFDWERTLVVSQFPPGQTWQAHAAMARNGIIFGLSKALLVIEAGERGGTLAAGEGALQLGRPVFAVDFGQDTPMGNRILINKGAVAIRTTAELSDALDHVHAAVSPVDPPSLF
ncbi:DNA-protecting protein DprA [Microbacterium sp. LWH7-1.2]|uniref:DNA-processing protein DprA n=1 Tax=Microbacterium sp. LWH7-1.2 TaxID=3135257 RepID=UPI003139AC3E